MGCGTLAGLAVSLAGTGAQMAASADEKDKMNKATDAELSRQQDIQKKATNVYQQNLEHQGAAPFKQESDAGTNRILQQYQQLQAVPLQLGQTKGAEQNYGMVNNQNQAARQTMSNQASAPLFGYQNALAGMGNRDILTNANLGLLGNESQASQAVLPLELQSASQADAGLAGLGSLLGTAGSLMGMAGATQAGPAAGGGLGYMSGPIAQGQQSVLTPFFGSGYGQMPNYLNNFAMGGY